MATHVSRHLYAQGHRIECIWSRTNENARKLASTVGSIGTSESSELPRKADFFLLAVPDDAIADVATQFPDCHGIWLHTAGSISIDVFRDLFPAYGVLYPLQSLSHDHPMRLGHIPFLVEGSSKEISKKVYALAESISGMVEEADSASRRIVHLAAVFANNFSNHMVHIAQEILKEQNMPVSMLDPLLAETFQKIQSIGAREAQTGPAVRNDQITMKRHIDLLKSHPEWEKMYTFISREIQNSREE